MGQKALYLYTLQGPIFKVLNIVLRKQNFDEYSGIYPLCTLISCGTVNFNDVNGDTKLPDHHIDANNNLIVYRGVPLDPGELDQYRKIKGREVFTRSFFSTSPYLQTCMEFATDPDALDAGKVPTIFEI